MMFKATGNGKHCEKCKPEKRINHLKTACTISLASFIALTTAIQVVDVQAAGQSSTQIGFAGLNLWFHQLTGVHMRIYEITDWLSIIPVAVCLGFAALGLMQAIKRKGILRVDPAILILGAYYMLVLGAYAIFEIFPINYRPVLIDGAIEASYPSSTTLLVLCVMPTLPHQINRRTSSRTVRNACLIFTIAFSVFMMLGRLVSGVHWLTDIIAGILLSAGLFTMYVCAVNAADGKNQSKS